ncbi:1-acylglycerol-3-phosphate O [Marasmius fiardii PR-910]|nr:1-acylglycerol-3-phosphate O [Marasmius fiardii PR-910]
MPMIMSFLSEIFKPLAYISLPVVFIRTFVMSSPKGRYYVRVGVFAATLGMVATVVTFIGAAMAAGGNRYDVCFMTARMFYMAGSRVLGITIKVEGDEHLQTRPAVYMSNHQSMLDILFVARTMPKKATITAKKSIQASPLGPFMMLAGAIFIDRGNNARAIRSLEAAGELMRKKRTSLWIYPEGTRNLSEVPDMLPFKKGGFHLAIQAGIPIVPVVSENYWHLYHKGHFEGGEARIRVLPPVPTTGMTAADVPELISKVRNQMLEALRDISSHVPAEKKSAIDSAKEEASSSHSSSARVYERDEKTPGPTVPYVPEVEDPTVLSRSETDVSIAGRTGSTTSISSSNHGVRTASEYGTETEEDEGMVLVGKPA